ncbi:EamA-like transporter family protein [Leptospira weilii serovar Ranarum str. ICFT]|uniref:EamA-like transporter family protein n=1 Tax=Leptospira weilii serovar Ranarum str. ICFT TaxID=1218598 RepID=N1WJX1_9LEPT|nr:DMT family transporter [Leptospira weilii]EMY79245.1 EamA-like transporter family protein [Leptospira weilii serovar Ranarum str. ICFT]
MPSNASAKFYVFLVVAMISWGFAWPSAKLIVGTQHPNVIIFWRFLATAISLFPIVLWRKESLRLPNYKTWFQVAIGGVLYTIYNQFFLLGLKNGLAGAGGVLVTTMNPIFTYVFVHSFQKKWPSAREGIGLLFGLVGGCILLGLWELDLNSLFLSGNIFFLLCAFSWAFLSINSHSTGQTISPLVYSFYVFTIGTILDFFLAFPFGVENALSSGPQFWFHILYLSVVSTTFGTTVYFFASSKLGSRVASSFIFLVPVTALLGSWIFLDEVPSFATTIGGTFAVFAVFLLNRNRNGNIQKD